jgi:uncharacterized iron-regulated membrane protein
MTPALIVLCVIVCVTVTGLYLGLYLWLRKKAHKEPHHNPLEAIDQPTKRAHLHWGPWGIKHHEEYRKGKK